MFGSMASPGHIRNNIEQTSITIGELDGSMSERMLLLHRSFEDAGVVCTISSDIISARWQKLLLVGPWSAVGAVTRAPLGVVRAIPETRRLLEGAMTEVAALARARGAKLPNDAVPLALAELDKGPAAGIGSSQFTRTSTPAFCPRKNTRVKKSSFRAKPWSRRKRLDDIHDPRHLEN